MPVKYPWQSKEDDKGAEELEARLKKAEEAVAEVSKINERLKSLDSITAFVEAQNKRQKDAEEAAAAAEEAAKNKKKGTQELSNEEFEELLQSNPRAAIAKATEGHAEMVLQMNARQLRREVFEDEQERFPYYAGEIKAEINKLLDKQPLGSQNSRDVVENAYYVVTGRKAQEISEGKIKSRFAGSSSSVSSGPKGGDDSREKVEIKVTPEIEKAARLSGISTKDYVELLRKDEEIEIV